MVSVFLYCDPENAGFEAEARGYLVDLLGQAEDAGGSGC